MILVYRSTLLVCVLLIAVGLCLNACRGKSGAQSQPAELPKGWPVPDLRPPVGSTRTSLFGLPEGLSSDGGYTIQGAKDAGDFEGELWAVAFESDLGWADIVAHTERSLKRRGYSALENPLQGTPNISWPAFQYLSADGLTLIMVARSVERSGKDGARNICMYKLTLLNELYSGSDYRRAL